MTFILFLLFAIVIFGVMLVISFVKGVSSFLFGKPFYSASNRYDSSNRNQQNEDSSYSSKMQRKIFSKDEGEYVSYEEIKESK